MAKTMIPVWVRDWLRRQREETSRWPRVGWVRFGSLRRVAPISRVFGYDRGQPIDRYYIEAFLARQAGEIRGHVLEIGDDAYTRRYGGDRVARSDVLHATPGNPRATLVADLAGGEGIPSDTFDCVILTQTLQHIYDVRGAIRTIYRILRVGGVVLASVPGISQVSRFDMERWGDYWRFTTHSSRRLFQEVFPAECVSVRAHGNVLAATAFLHGLAAEELKQEELDHADPDYELLITVRAMKPEGSSRGAP